MCVIVACESIPKQTTENPTRQDLFQNIMAAEDKTEKCELEMGYQTTVVCRKVSYDLLWSFG